MRGVRSQLRKVKSKSIDNVRNETGIGAVSRLHLDSWHGCIPVREMPGRASVQEDPERKDSGEHRPRKETAVGGEEK